MEPHHHQAKALFFYFRGKENTLYFLVHTHKFTSSYIHGHLFSSEERGHSRQISHFCMEASSLLFLSLSTFRSFPPSCISMLKSLLYLKIPMFLSMWHHTIIIPLPQLNFSEEQSILLDSLFHSLFSI